MKRLYVGCRVRVVYTTGGGLLGAEARITKWVDRSFNSVVGWHAGWQLDVKNRYGVQAVAKPEWLEPILPSGHQACDTDFKRDLDKLLERQGVAA